MQPLSTSQRLVDKRLRGRDSRRGEKEGREMPWVEEWPSQGACQGEDPDALFVQGAAQQQAKLVCRACPVRSECLAHALDTRTEFGVWGGMTERERRQWLRDHPGVTSWRTLLERAKDEHEGGRVGAAPRQRGAVNHDSRSTNARAS